MAGQYEAGNYKPLSPNFTQLQVLPAAPNSIATGRTYFDSTILEIGVYANGGWNYVGGGGGGGSVLSVFGRTGTITAHSGDYSGIYFPVPTGTSLQYVAGNGTLVTFPTNVSSFTNNAGYLTSASALAWSSITGTPTTASGYGLTDVATLTGTQTLSNKTITGYQPTITLTTTGSSGAATFSGNILNIPQYSGGGTITLTTTGTSGAATLIGSTLNVPNYTYTPASTTKITGVVGAGGSPFAAGTTYTNSAMANFPVLVFRNKLSEPDVNPATGDSYFTKTLSSNTITFSSALTAGELIQVIILPS